MNYCIWCHHQGEGFLLQGIARPQDRRVPEIGVRRHAGRLPAGGAHLGDARAARAGLCARGLRDHRDRQPDDGGDRPPHLQRLHEGLHLPEAGAGRHSAGRDRDPARRARAALGLRDLRAADALEPARHPPPAAAPALGAQRAGRRPRPGRLHARAPPAERRPHRRRDRRAEDRAARLRSARAGARRRDPLWRTSTSARWRASAASPSTASPCAGTRTTSSSCGCCWSGARDFAAFGGVRFGGGATVTIDDALAMGFDHVALCMGAGRPTVLDIPNALARGVRAGVRLPDGAATDRRGQAQQHRQPATAPAGRRHRRRPDRDRHRDREPRLLRPPGRGPSPPAIARSSPSAASTPCALGWTEEETRRSPASSSPTPPRSPPSATRAAAEGRAPRVRQHCSMAGAAPRSPIAAACSTAPPTRSTTRRWRRRWRRASASPRASPRSRSRPTRTATPRRLRLSRADGSEAVLPARAVLVAAGTQPNTVLAREDGRIALDGRYFQAIDEAGARVAAAARPRQAGARRGADAPYAGRPLPELLRRSAPELLRQRRQGDGQRQARLPDRLARRSRPGRRRRDADLIAACRDALSPRASMTCTA